MPVAFQLPGAARPAGPPPMIAVCLPDGPKCRQRPEFFRLPVRRPLFQMTNPHRTLYVGPLILAAGLARPGANPPQNARQHIVFLVDQRRLVQPAMCDVPDVLGNVGLCRAGRAAGHVPLKRLKSRFFCPDRCN